MSESKEEIMEAAYTVLCEDGYAGLSIQSIADQAGMGKSAIYYHFDDKEDLMLTFLDFMGQKIHGDQQEIIEKPPREAIDRLLDMSLGVENQEQWEFYKAFQEFRAQAQHNEKYQEKFREIDARVVENISEIMEQLGAERPEPAAEILLSMIEGSMSRKVSAGDREGLEDLKEDIKETISVFLDGEGCEGLEAL